MRRNATSQLQPGKGVIPVEYLGRGIFKEPSGFPASSEVILCSRQFQFSTIWKEHNRELLLDREKKTSPKLKLTGIFEDIVT